MSELRKTLKEITGKEGFKDITNIEVIKVLVDEMEDKLNIINDVWVKHLEKLRDKIAEEEKRRLR